VLNERKFEALAPSIIEFYLTRYLSIELSKTSLVVWKLASCITTRIRGFLEPLIPCFLIQIWQKF